MSKDTGGPAFPDDSQHDYNGGMTLRDYFAAKAMQSLLSYYEMPAGKNNIAKHCYQLADAMLLERDK